MGFQELTDEQWVFLAPLLPPKAKTGRPRVDDRKVLNLTFRQEIGQGLGRWP